MGATLTFTEPKTGTSADALPCFEEYVVDFPGYQPLEETLINGFATLPNLDLARKLLMQHCSESANPLVLARTLMVMAATGKLRSFIRPAMPELSDEVLNVRLCNRRHLAEIDSRIYPLLAARVPAVFQELRGFGIADSYVSLFESTFPGSFQSRVDTLVAAVVLTASVTLRRAT